MKKPTEKKKERNVVEKITAKVTYAPKPDTVRIWNGKWEEVKVR
jgi:hypothetical protein